MKITDVFGSNVFSESVMRQRLPDDAYREVRHVLENGGRISLKTADVVAKTMMDWAVEKGATHYTHWFQPLTGITAEKHDSFLTYPREGKTILRLTGRQLIMGEPDASSFPTGGLCATHYARGYTAWDITSPAFIKEMSAGKILCIPTIFVSYTGESLDNKTPLLHSMEAISEQALRIVRLFGNTAARKVTPSVGPEQEYFIVDQERFGAPAPKGQELEDQYFGVIRERIGGFMRDLNLELWKLGIPATTQHNEVAPAQHELASIYTTCNVAVDQNQLTMETMKRVATKHGLVCLLHEKPFAGVNGSGKHNNWSIATDTGENLLDPGETPNENLQFLLVLSCIMQAVDDHADLLRNAAANVGNDERLGADEAPPAIISIFLGSQLDDLVDQICTHGSAAASIAAGWLDAGVSTLPVIMKDATDRNRTSPFAFTGNKFEFRAVGSSDSIAGINTVLNTIVADAFAKAADELEQAADFQTALNDLIARNMRSHKRIIFNGDGYSHEWVTEAARRGLPNLRNMVDAIPVLNREENVALFEKYKIFTRSELESRTEVLYETFTKMKSIEARTMVHMAGKHYVPSVVRFITRMSDSVNKTLSASPEADVSVQRDLIQRCSALLSEAYREENTLNAEVERLNDLDAPDVMAQHCQNAIVPHMKALRRAVDALELIVDKDLWPVPTYGDLMFEV